MKKFVSTFAASLMAVSALTAVSASALNIKANNALAITTDFLKTSITADNGTVIPAGAISVTVSISGNTGFSAKSVKLDVGSADVIVDESGSPVVDSGDVLGNSLIGSAENNGIVMLASASADELKSDGEMFTFYVASDSAEVAIIDVDVEVAVTDDIMPMASLHSYIIGDVSGNGYINSIDSTHILMAIKEYRDTIGAGDDDDVSLPVGVANGNLSKYFPYDSIERAEAADCDKNDEIDEDDAGYVLEYYSELAVGKNPEDIHIEHVGEVVFYIN